jgi:hypothetical protein
MAISFSGILYDLDVGGIKVTKTWKKLQQDE